MATASTLDRLYDMRELEAANYGDRTTIRRLIKTQGIPAVRVGQKLKIRESDLHLLAVPVTPEEISSDEVPA